MIETYGFNKIEHKIFTKKFHSRLKGSIGKSRLGPAKGTVNGTNGKITWLSNVKGLY